MAFVVGVFGRLRPHLRPGWSALHDSPMPTSTTPDVPASADRTAKPAVQQPALIEIDEYFARLPVEREQVLRDLAQLDDHDATDDAASSSGR